MKYDPRIHHRRSIRLQGYDYSQSGDYFVTVCTHDRAFFLLDDIVCDVVESTWHQLPNRFANLLLDEFVIMPNHIHGIIVFTEPDIQANRERIGLADVVGAFKSISAIAANQALGRSGTPFWQRNYYEHVIRSEEKLNQLRQYVRDNPEKWADDPNNPDKIRRRHRPSSGAVSREATLGAGQAPPLPISDPLPPQRRDL